MKNRKLFISIMAGILAALMIFGLIAGVLPTYVSAEDNRSSSEIQQEINEWKDKKEEIDAQIKEIEGQISDNMDQMEEIVAQKNLIDQKVFLLYQQVENINDQIAAYGDLIANKQEELDRATARYQELNIKNKERIRAMEENGSLSYWSVLFKANSFSDLLDRLNMINEIAAADQRRLAELNEAAQLVEAAKTEIEADKLEAEESRKELDAALAELDVARLEAEELLNQLVATGEEYQRLLDEAEERESEASATIDELEYAYDEAKEREYQEWLAAQPKPEPPTGGIAGAPNNVDGVTWLIPVNYTRFSSPFGYRIHPVYGDWRFHYGVDLSAPEGTPIIASRSGQVTTATYDSSSGYYVSINHLDGFSTRYLHMTHYIVEPGEYVVAGQIIGYCGSTGTSTGPHLHFSILYNGSHVNPANYINI